MAEPPIISITFNDNEVQRYFDRLLQKTSNPTPALKSIGEAMLLSIDGRFETETDVRGVPFVPNSARTIAKKRAEGRIQKILQSRGIYRNSFNYRVTGNRVIIGTTTQYAVKHEKGIGVPRRQVLGVSESDRKEIVEILKEYLTQSP